MIKTVKICDKCGKECSWLYVIPFMNIKGYKIEFLEDNPSGTAHNEYCEECTRKIIEKFNDMVLRQKF